jgi:hypothetical protein
VILLLRFALLALFGRRRLAVRLAAIAFVVIRFVYRRRRGDRSEVRAHEALA